MTSTAWQIEFGGIFELVKLTGLPGKFVCLNKSVFEIPIFKKTDLQSERLRVDFFCKHFCAKKSTVSRTT